MSLPSFEATLTTGMIQLLEQPTSIFDILERESSPLSISFPNEAVSAAESFHNIFDELSVSGRTFVAHKSTSSKAIVKALVGKTAIDVASEAELKNAIDAGFATDSIVATGPKSNRFLERLCQHEGIVIAVDSFSELERLSTFASQRPMLVLLRLTRSVVNMQGINKRSRFGLDAASLELALSFIAGQSNITLRGVSFHLDSQSIDERYAAVQRALQLLLDVQRRGHSDATVLDIGGGYGALYGLTPAQYQEFKISIKQMISGERAPFTWQSYGYGLASNGMRLQGSLSGLDLPRYVVGADDLRALLTMDGETGTTIAEQLSESLVELWIEPGAAISSAAGIVVAEVIEVRDMDGDKMVVVDAHRNQICFEGNEQVADPIVLSREERQHTQSGEAYIVGHLCMENDFMTYRKLAFNQMPQAGDCIVWTHTGAYRSHFSASRAIGHPLPSKYVYMSETGLEKEIS